MSASPPSPSDSDTTPVRAPVASARRVVLKLGTRVLTLEGGHIAQSRLFSVVEEVARARAVGREVLVVSSGAVGLGRQALGLDAPPTTLEDRQACAAVGQSLLMALYRDGFARLGLAAGQVLLTQGDFDDRGRYLRLRATLSRLLSLGVVPVINANDAVSTEELAFLEVDRTPIFGDNDKLSALVAARLDADLLVLLTDVDGLFPDDPRTRATTAPIARVDPDDALGHLSGDSGSSLGRGGIRSKVEAARIATRAGCHAVIASGIRPEALPRVLAGAPEGTWFPAQARLPARERWIAFAAGGRGTLQLDAGALRALREQGASLLAAGVTRVEGTFAAGDVVDLLGPDGTVVGRGVVSCDQDQARAWCAGRPPDGVRNHDALVHRDHLVLH